MGMVCFNANIPNSVNILLDIREEIKMKPKRVGEIGTVRTKNGRKITLKRIRTTGFPQYIILKNEPMR